jgi:hypothetical protein
MPQCFGRTARCASSVRRMLKYMDVGFTLDGDGAWDDDEEAERMLLRVARAA